MPINNVDHVPRTEGVEMRKQRWLLCALLFSVSSWVSAGVPIIKLSESQRVEVNFYSQVALDDTFSGIKDDSKSAETDAGNGMSGLQSVPASAPASGFFSGILTQTGRMSTLTDRQLGAGSFSSYVRGATATFGASVSDAGPGSAELRYGAMVASPPALKSWAVLLLVIGCVIYLGRRRKRPFGYQKLH